MGIDYGNSFRLKKSHRKMRKNGAVYVEEAGFWIMKHLVKGHHRTLAGKFETEEAAEKAYAEWVKINVK